MLGYLGDRNSLRFFYVYRVAVCVAFPSSKRRARSLFGANVRVFLREECFCVLFPWLFRAERRRRETRAFYESAEMTTLFSANATVNPTSVLVNDCPTSLDWLERASIYVERT